MKTSLEHFRDIWINGPAGEPARQNRFCPLRLSGVPQLPTIAFPAVAGGVVGLGVLLRGWSFRSLKVALPLAVSPLCGTIVNGLVGFGIRQVVFARRGSSLSGLPAEPSATEWEALFQRINLGSEDLAALKESLANSLSVEQLQPLVSLFPDELLEAKDGRLPRLKNPQPDEVDDLLELSDRDDVRLNLLKRLGDRIAPAQWQDLARGGYVPAGAQFEPFHPDQLLAAIRAFSPEPNSPPLIRIGYSALVNETVDSAFASDHQAEVVHVLAHCDDEIVKEQLRALLPQPPPSPCSKIDVRLLNEYRTASPDRRGEIAKAVYYHLAHLYWDTDLARIRRELTEMPRPPATLVEFWHQLEVNRDNCRLFALLGQFCSDFATKAAEAKALLDAWPSGWTPERPLG